MHFILSGIGNLNRDYEPKTFQTLDELSDYVIEVLKKEDRDITKKTLGPAYLKPNEGWQPDGFVKLYIDIVKKGRVILYNSVPVSSLKDLQEIKKNLAYGLKKTRQFPKRKEERKLFE